MEQLLNELKPYIKKIAKEYYNDKSKLEYNDILQQCYLIFVKTYRQVNANNINIKGNIKSYYLKAIRYDMNRYIKKYHSDPLSNAISIEDIYK